MKEERILLTEEEIKYFFSRIRKLPPRKTDIPGNIWHQANVASPDYGLTPKKDGIHIHWGFYYATIARETEEKHKGKFYVYVEHEDGVLDCVGTIMSMGWYSTKEECWRGLVARMRRVIK